MRCCLSVSSGLGEGAEPGALCDRIYGVPGTPKATVPRVETPLLLSEDRSSYGPNRVQVPNPSKRRHLLALNSSTGASKEQCLKAHGRRSTALTTAGLLSHLAQQLLRGRETSPVTLKVTKYLNYSADIMNGRGDANSIAPLLTGASYGSTLTSDVVSASTSSIGSARSRSDGDLQADMPRPMDGSRRQPPAQEHQLERQNSSSTVRINAVEDSTSGLRSSEFPGLIDMYMLVLGICVLSLHWGDKDTKEDSSTTPDESYAHDWRQWLVVALVVKALIASVSLVSPVLGLTLTKTS